MTEMKDVVGEVLSKNAEGFEKKDARMMATVGFILAALNGTFAVIFFLFYNAPIETTIFMVINALTLSFLSWRVQQYSALAGKTLFLTVILLICGLLSQALSEGPSYSQLIARLIVGGIIITKMYPGISSLKILSSTYP
ncbi:hypothetical protein [Kordiimonas pumila]|uniref:GtrA-like protein domain-containing protein n=1 Tax=Kordiimonas pumila TaxID=2161677 RepID=A0ABV7D4V1_9PROT|nr:hypothetical protein [Kordiimonas pumila]